VVRIHGAGDACDIADMVATGVRRLGQAIQREANQLAEAGCGALANLADTICSDVARTVCDATETVAQSVCDATHTIPFLGGVICWLSHTVSHVICIASHIVVDTVCVAVRITGAAACAGLRLLAVGAGAILGGSIEVFGIGLGGLAEFICLVTAAPKTPLRPRMPPGDTRIDPRINGDQVMPLLAADIEAATHRIHISMFLFFNDPIGQWLADKLIARASNKENPINVRVMFDFGKTRLGDPFSTSEKAAVAMDPNFSDDPVDVDAIVQRLRRGGVQVLRTNIDYDAVVSTSDSTYRQEARTIRRAIFMDTPVFGQAIEVMDHRKIITIDDHVGYLGSANVGCQYLYRNAYAAGTDADVEVALELLSTPPGMEPWLKWHDSLTRVEGPVAYVLEEYFRRRWVLNGGDEYHLRPPQFAPPTAPPNVEVFVATPGFRNDIRRQFVRRIREAKTSIFIEHSYCYHPKIIDELIAARWNPRLDITMIVPDADYNDNPLSQDAQEYCYEDLLNAGVKIFEFDHHFTHLKLATFDSRWSIIGSANLNYRSLEWNRDFEVAIVVNDPATARLLEAHVQAADIAGACHRITLENLTFGQRHRNPLTIAAEIAKAL